MKTDPARHLLDATADENYELAREARDAASDLARKARKQKAAQAPQNAVASIVQQQSGPIVVAAIVIAIACAFIAGHLMATIPNLTQRVDLLEVYKTRHEGRLNALENPADKEK